MAAWLEHPDLGRLDLDWRTQDGIARVSWEIGVPEVREVTEGVVDGDGEWDQSAHHGASMLSLELAVFGPLRDELIDRLRSFCQPRLRPVFGYEWNGTTRRLVLRTDRMSAPRTNPGSDQVQMSWRVPSGVQESYEANVLTVLPETTAATGRTYPRSYPINYRRVSSGATAPAPFLVAGTAPVMPLLRLYGPCERPRVEHIESGARLEFTRGDALSIASGEFLEVDFEYRTVRLNGDPAENRYRHLAASTWFRFMPGRNHIRFYPVGWSGSAMCEVQWRDRWI